jgi:uncharacterized protein
MRIRPSGIFNTALQMALVIVGFIAVIAVVESKGLEVWAERLEIGPLRKVAVPLTSAWHRAIRPLGMDKLRRTAMVDLQKVGWSDDPVQPAETPAASTKGLPAFPKTAAGAPAPLVARLPQSTPLPRLAAVPDGRPRVIALAGDSMMTVGLSAVLLRETAKHQELQTIKAFHSGTGLARPEVFDWMKQYPALLGSSRPDLVFVSIGANDGQGFVEKGEVLAFGTEKWIEVYRRRLNDFLDLLTADGAQVLWIGLPPMKRESYNLKIDTINRIAYTEVTARPQVSWWNCTPIIGDQSGKFREFFTSPQGKTFRIRASDGIHLSDNGAALLITELMRWLTEQPMPQIPAANHPAASSPIQLKAASGVLR